MRKENLSKDFLEKVENLRFNSLTIEADINEAIEEAKDQKDALERISKCMDNLVEEATGVKELLCT